MNSDRSIKDVADDLAALLRRHAELTGRPPPELKPFPELRPIETVIRRVTLSPSGPKDEAGNTSSSSPPDADAGV